MNLGAPHMFVDIIAFTYEKKKQLQPFLTMSHDYSLFKILASHYKLDYDSESIFFVSIMKVILQLAESGSFFGQVDLFKVRGKFALSDAYEDHFLLPKGKIFVVTHRRVILLQVS